MPRSESASAPRPGRVLHLQSGNRVLSHVKLNYHLQQEFRRQADGAIEMTSFMREMHPRDHVQANHRLLKLKVQFLHPLALLFRRNYDLYHIHCWTLANYLRVISKHKQRLITVHDLNPFHFPENFREKTLRECRQVMSQIGPDDHLVAITAAVADDLVRTCGFSPDQITVIRNGVDVDHFKIAADLPASLSQLRGVPHLVVIGTNDPRKNLKILPAVVEKIAREFPEVKVLRIGPPLTAEIAAQFAERAGTERLVYAEKLSEQDLAAVYQHAGCLFFPSLFEGFGMPVAEALASGTPLACSNIAPHLEVTAGHAMMFAPDDIEQAARQVSRCLRRESSVEETIAAGRKHIDTLSWKNCARQYLELYKKLLESSR